MNAVVPFRNDYHALLGRTSFARFNAVVHYAYLKLKMPDPRSVITVNGNMERSLHTEEHRAAIEAEVQSGPIKPHTSLAIRPPDFSTQDQSVLHAGSPATSGLD